MVDFNLLPWRAAQKSQQIKTLLILSLAAVLFAMFASGFAHWLLATQIALRSATVSREEEIIAKLEQKTLLVTKVKMQPSLPPVETNLQALFLRLGEELGWAVCFTELNAQHHQFHFKGNANSMYDLTTFLNTWPLGSLFAEVKIKKISTAFPLIQFQFATTLKK